MEIPELNNIGNKVKGWQTEETRYYKALPMSNYVLSAIAFLGLVAACMPWADVTVGFYSSAIAIGLSFFKGWLCFLSFAAIIALLLFNKHLKIHEKYIEITPLLASFIAIILAIAFLIWHLFQVHFGVYLTVLFAVIEIIAFYYYKRKQA